MPLDNGHGDGHGGGRKVGRNDPALRQREER